MREVEGLFRPLNHDWRARQRGPDERGNDTILMIVDPSIYIGEPEDESRPPRTSRIFTHQLFSLHLGPPVNVDRLKWVGLANGELSWIPVDFPAASVNEPGRGFQSGEVV